MTTKVLQSLHAHYTYPVIFSRNVFAPGSELLNQVLAQGGNERPARILAFVDSGLASANPLWLDGMRNWFNRSGTMELVMEPTIVTGGETIKNDYRLVMQIVDTILENRLCRHSYVLAAGGGAVLDAVGFATSIVHRGLRLLRFPSTVLAQNDAGIGVKTGMNLHGGKNTIGTFAPPFAVVNDFSLLESLDQIHWRSGISEAVKVGLLKDPAFFEWICNHAVELQARAISPMEHLIARCAELHLDHIAHSGDPFEQGSARPLDFGHWAAHQLECISNYRITHGDAVAAGIALDATYSRLAGWLPTSQTDAILNCLTTCGFPLWYSEMQTRRADGRRMLFAGLEAFREHLGGQLSLTMLHGPGKPFEANSIREDLLELAALDLQAFGSRTIAPSQP